MRSGKATGNGEDGPLLPPSARGGGRQMVQEAPAPTGSEILREKVPAVHGACSSLFIEGLLCARCLTQPV